VPIFQGADDFCAGRILLEPTISSVKMTAHKGAVGIPTLFISFASVAPQHSLVPHKKAP
jgi:hypothetical protein